jgi:ubiquinol-cytochrome c reductase cytochrome b subunit
MQLAERHGVPPEGPGSLFADDPLTRGPELFAANCAACHRMDGHNGLGVAMNEPAASSDLAGFASRDWIRGLLTDPMGERYLGRMKNPDGGPAHTRMAKWLGEMRASQTTDDQRKQFDADLDAVAAYLADESIQPGRLAGLDATDAPTSPDEQTIHHGRSVFTSVCNECHRYAGENTGTFRAPDMLGYGSVEWIERLIDDPSDDLLYRGKGREPARMPSFHDRLTESERRLIAHWLHESRGVREAVSDRVPLTATER